MNDKELDDALQGLRTELSFDPSPEFAAKVRQQVEQAPARSFWNVWTWTAVAATCGIAVVAGAILLRPNSGVVVAPGAPTTDLASAPSITQTPMPGTMPTTTTKTATPKPVVVNAAATRELEVLVPQDQLIAIRQLMSAVRSGAAKDVPAAQPLIDPATGELVAPKLIESKPIEIPLISIELLPGLGEGRSGGSERK